MSHRWRILLVALLLTAASVPVSAQERLLLGFYNVENLFDTVPSPLHDDSDFTPGGRKRWNTGRYTAKVGNLARVIDRMSPDLLAVAEVENEGVVRDLVTALTDDYNYIFRLVGDGGRNLALLYRGDKFVPVSVRSVGSGVSRRFLHVSGMLRGERVDIVVCHLPSMLNDRRYRRRALEGLYTFADSLQASDPASQVVVMGDFNMSPGDRLMRQTFMSEGSRFCSPLNKYAADGAGTYAYDNRWLLYDNIFLGERLADEGLTCIGSGIFIRPWMLEGGGVRRGYPRRTHTGGRYTGGFSDHLPVYVILSVGR